METVFVRAMESILVLGGVMTAGAILGAFVGHYSLGEAKRKGNTRVKAHDRLNDDTNRFPAYSGIKLPYQPPPPPVNLHQEIARAILQDRSARSRKGWQTRRREREAQKDADIKMLMGMK